MYDKEIKIASTSISGAFLVAWGIGGFIGHFPEIKDLKSSWKISNGDNVDDQLIWVWVYVSIIVLVSVIGASIQYKHVYKIKGDNY